MQESGYAVLGLGRDELLAAIASAILQRHGALFAAPGRGLAPGEAPEVAGVQVVAHDGPADLELG